MISINGQYETHQKNSNLINCSLWGSSTMQGNFFKTTQSNGLHYG
jgi:hypothetical protein